MNFSLYMSGDHLRVINIVGIVYDGVVLQRLQVKKGSLGAIMRQGRWKHENTVHGYIEEGNRFEANVADAIFDTL